ncbi:MAG: ABC transporter substrate-binding protein [Anaerolineaceae bacterium]|nr:ABC transporter substrate-binding protein [Anaerolineaceae bacterium]
MRNKFKFLVVVLLVLAMVLVACKPKPEEVAEEVVVEEEPVVVEEVDVSVEEEDVVEEEEEVVEEVEEEVVEIEPNPYDGIIPASDIVFWHQHSGDREEVLQEIVQAFNDTNEYGITLTAEYQGGYGDIFNKMLPILGTPDVPDLVVAYQNQSATYQLAEALADINPMIDNAEFGLTDDDIADFFPGFYAQDINPAFDNMRTGFPPNRSMEVMYYNMDWLTELGYDAPPATPEEFREMACAATANPFSGATIEGSMGYKLSVDASRLASWTFAFGGNVFNYAGAEYSYDDPGVVASMQFIQDLINEGCADIVTERYGDQTDFGNGSLLFTVGSSSGLPYYGSAVDDGAGFEWSVAPLPHTTAEPVQNVYGASVSIPASTPEREIAAWLFVKYYTSPEVQAKWAMASGYFPVRSSVAAGLTDYFDANPAYKTAFDMLQYGVAEPPVPGYDFARDLASEAMAAIVDGADVAETLAKLDADSDVILADQLAQID